MFTLKIHLMEDIEIYPPTRQFPANLEPIRQPIRSEEDLRNDELAEEIAALSA